MIKKCISFPVLILYYALKTWNFLEVISFDYFWTIVEITFLNLLSSLDYLTGESGSESGMHTFIGICFRKDNTKTAGLI